LNSLLAGFGVLGVCGVAQESVGPLAWMQRHQVPVYVAAMAVGAGIGVFAPGLGRGLEQGITPVLGALLYVTFLQVPAAQLLRSLRDGTFLGAALVVNFVVVPLVVAAMFSFLPADQAVRLGVLLVLLTPCVDYVIVFCGLAGGAAHRLLAATPLLLILQMLLLPAFLVLFMGQDLADVVEIGPFVEAFIVLIVIPLTLAWLTQAWAGRHRSGVVLTDAMGTVMVPLLALALLVVVASQVPQAWREFRGGGAGGAVLRGLPADHGGLGEVGGAAVPPRPVGRAGHRVHRRDPQFARRAAVGPRPARCLRGRRARDRHANPGRGDRDGPLRTSRTPIDACQVIHAVTRNPPVIRSMRPGEVALDAL
jgi:predicted Na+-dependent transporter